MLTFKLMLLTIFSVVQLNCENLFDCRHDSLKNDFEFLPNSYKHWTEKRYWNKINNISKEIVACGNYNSTWTMPSVITLCEIENDSVIRDLTKRGPLKTLRYNYVATNSLDSRGIDVALLYNETAFKLLNHRSIRVNKIEGMSNTRDILYCEGVINTGDSMHIFVVHSPSRRGGEKVSMPFRMAVASKLCSSIDSIKHKHRNAKIIVSGDFNDYSNCLPLKKIEESGLLDVSKNAKGLNYSCATYKYRGEWNSLDHIFVSLNISINLKHCYVVDFPFLLCEDKKYGGKQPFRCYNGAKYSNAFSDHLPLVARFEF